MSPGGRRGTCSAWAGWGLSVEWWSAGAIVGAEIGGQYAYLPAALGSAPGHGLGEPAAGTLEGELCNLPGSYVLDAARLQGIFGGCVSAFTLRTDSATNRSYFPLDPAQLADMAGILFVESIEQAPAGRAEESG